MGTPESPLASKISLHHCSSYYTYSYTSFLPTGPTSIKLDAGISAFHRRALGLRQELDGAVWQKFGARIQATMIDQAEQGEDRGSAAVAGAAAPAGTGGASRKTESLFATIMLDDILILEEPEKPPQPQVVGTGTGGQGQGTQSRNESGVDSESSTSVADEEKGAVGGKKGK